MQYYQFCLLILKNQELSGGIHIIFFLFRHKKIYCGYSLEALHWGASNEYPQHMFSWRNKKNIKTFLLKKAPYLKVWIDNQESGSLTDSVGNAFQYIGNCQKSKCTEKCMAQDERVDDDGLEFYKSLSTLFKSYWDNRRVIMKCSVQWSVV